MTLEELNAIDPAVATRELLRCCGSRRWAEKMAAARPFMDADVLMVTSDVIWNTLDREDWLEAFAAHPEIGDGARLKPRTPSEQRAWSSLEREASAGRWSADEQSAVATATERVRERLAVKNREYRSRFGYIFIVCATGRSADEMLSLLEQRLRNDPSIELRTAAEEQRKITRLRLAKLLEMASVR